jgi:hypothetical protein
MDQGGAPEQPSATDEAERRRRVTLGGSYLGQAVDEIRSSGSPDALYRSHPPRGQLPADPTRRAIVMVAATAMARRRRVESSRSAILYCILAAEAYANQYLQWHLTGAEFNAADRLPTFDKFLLGPRLVHGGDVLKRGAEPAQTLQELLKLRSDLVHPKLLPARPAGGAADDPPEFEDFNPYAAARYLITTADAVSWLLASSRPEPRVDIVAAVIDQERQLFLDFAKRATHELPPFGSEPAPDLFIEAIRRANNRTQAEPPAAGT